MTLTQLVALYGYPMLVALVLVAAAGAPLPITVLLLTAGALSATRGGPNFWLLAALGTGAAVAGDLADYALGRMGGARLLRWIYRRRRRRLGASLRAARRLLRRRGGIVVFLSRFLFTSISSPVSLLVGISRLPLSRFLVLSLAGKGIYVAGNLLLGRIFGASLAGYESQTVIAAEAAALGVVLPLGVVLALRALRRRRQLAAPPAADSRVHSTTAKLAAARLGDPAQQRRQGKRPPHAPQR